MHNSALSVLQHVIARAPQKEKRVEALKLMSDRQLNAICKLLYGPDVETSVMHTSVGEKHVALFKATIKMNSCYVACIATFGLNDVDYKQHEAFWHDSEFLLGYRYEVRLHAEVDETQPHSILVAHDLNDLSPAFVYRGDLVEDLRNAKIPKWLNAKLKSHFD